jgi:hypothetical protein
MPPIMAKFTQNSTSSSLTYKHVLRHAMLHTCHHLHSVHCTYRPGQVPGTTHVLMWMTCSHLQLQPAPASLHMPRHVAACTRPRLVLQHCGVSTVTYARTQPSADRRGNRAAVLLHPAYHHSSKHQHLARHTLVHAASPTPLQYTDPPPQQHLTCTHTSAKPPPHTPSHQQSLSPPLPAPQR